MNNFNLDSSTYDLTELENLLELQMPYTIELLEEKQKDMRQKIITMPEVESNKKKNIVIFLDNIINRLTDNLKQNNLIFIEKNNNNPISKNISPEIKYIKKLINIDSIFRNNYYSTKSSNFTFILPDKINKVVKMTIYNLQIPLSNYNISSYLGNNSFTITYDNIKRPIPLPDGNYTTQFKDFAASIEVTINKLIEQEFSTTTNNIKFCVDKISGKSIFTSDKSLTIDFTMDDNTKPLCFKLGWLLGFRSGTYTNSINNTIVSEGICNITGSKYLFLGIDDYQNTGNNSFIANFNESTLPSNIITRLNIDTSKQESGIYTTSLEGDLNSSLYNNYREYFGPVDIQKLTFTLYDNFGRIIDLNNMDWSLVLSLSCQFD